MTRSAFLTLARGPLRTCRTIIEATRWSVVVKTTRRAFVIEATRSPVIAIAAGRSLLIVEPTRRAFIVKASWRPLVAIATRRALIVAIAAWALVIETTRRPLVVAAPARRALIVKASRGTVVVEPARRTLVVEPARWAIFEPTRRALIVRAAGRSLLVIEPTRRTLVIKASRRAIALHAARLGFARLAVVVASRRTCGARRLTCAFFLLGAALGWAQRLALAVQVGRTQRLAGGAYGIAFVVAAHAERCTLARAGGALSRVAGAALVVVARKIIGIGSHESRPVRLALRWRAHQAARFQARAAVCCPGSDGCRRPGRCLPRARPAC